MKHSRGTDGDAPNGNVLIQRILTLALKTNEMVKEWRQTTTRTCVKRVGGVRLTMSSLRTRVKREGAVRLTTSRLRQLRAPCSSSCCA